MTFLRELLAAILGVFISFFIMFMVFLAMISVVSSSFMEEEAVIVKSNSVLVLNLNERIKDYAPVSDDPIEQLMGVNDGIIGLNEVLNAIDNAKYDDNITGISIETLVPMGGMAQIQELRDKLYEFKESGKFVMSFSDVLIQKNYYLSSVADSIYLNPEGYLDFRGLAGEVLYFKDFQDKYGLKMEVIRHGKYKSAVEPFLANEMSEANREQTEAFLNGIWKDMIEDIEESRGIDQNTLNEVADGLLARTPELAMENRMISGTLYKDEYANKLKALCGLEEDDDLKTVGISDYIKSGKGRIRSDATDRIAVIFAQGEIRYGEGDENYIGQKLIVDAIKKARQSSSVKGIVLRVNSPGGSALASDIIWREVDLTTEEKPVVVSMGSMAASGGYYIACSADEILAEPTTITGSIGVFGMVPNISEFTDRIGINAEQVGTHKRSLDYSMFEPMSEEFYETTKEGIERVYSSFVSKVAEGRGMSFEEVHELAQGRVWTGTQAYENGLVDGLGGLEDAIELAAELAEIEHYRVRNYPSYEKEFKDFFKGPFGSVKQGLIKEELGSEYYELYEQVKQFSEWKGIQARLPFMIEID